MWDLPGPGIKPVSPALAGRFLTTAPPGKSQNSLFNKWCWNNWIPTYKRMKWNFPGGPVVKNPPSNAGDTGLIPGQGTKIPHSTGQLLSPRASTREALCSKLQSPRTLEPPQNNYRPHTLWSPHTTTGERKPAHHNWRE